MRALKKFRPSTDLGALFATTLRPVEEQGLHPLECKNLLSDAYRNYAQKDEDWDPGKDAVFRRYMSSIDQAQTSLGTLREARTAGRIRLPWPRRLPYWPLFIAYMILKYGFGVGRGQAWAAFAALTTWMAYNCVFVHMARWGYRHLADSRYERGLQQLLADVDARGNDLPALEIGAPTPRRLPPPGATDPLPE